MIPAELGEYQLESSAGVHALLSYVPTLDDPDALAWRAGQPQRSEAV